MFLIHSHCYITDILNEKDFGKFIVDLILLTLHWNHPLPNSFLFQVEIKSVNPLLLSKYLF